MEPLLNGSELWREDHVARDAADGGHGDVLSVGVFHDSKAEGEVLDNVCVSWGCQEREERM